MQGLAQNLVSRFRSSTVVATGLLCAALMSPLPAVAVDLKMASGYPDANYLTATVRGFIADVEQRTGGSLKIELHNNQSLVKLPEMLRAVQTGQVALADVRLGNYGNQDPAYILDAIPFVASGPDDVLRLWQASKPYLTESFGKRGVKVLFALWNPPQGFYTLKPVTSASDLAGLKLRIYSTETRRMGELLKADPLIVQFGEVPQAFATGLINAMFTSPQTGIDTQAWDFVKNLTMVGALYTKQLVVINADVFDKLAKDQQQALMAAAEIAEKAGFAKMQATTNEQLELIKSKGMQVSTASLALLDELKKVGMQMEEDWKAKASADQRAVLDAYKQLSK